MKRYLYQPSHFFIQMTLPGIFTGMIGVFSIFQVFRSEYSILYLLVLGLCIYNVWNVFISLSNPSEIIVDDNQSIEFCAYRRSHKYEMNQIQQFSMRPLAGNTRMYMTINNGGLLKGRYWIRICEFSNEKELEEFFYDLDVKINPESLVSNARSQGRERLKKLGKL